MSFEILEVIVRDIPSFHSLAIKASRDFCERIVKNVTYLARVSSNRNEISSIRRNTVLSLTLITFLIR